ncbi:hypothetical protein B0H12DRAFT_1077124 [Mycena haematopus]|nr:hypothetical protein B0H12DRAFT_1077124 [Mycena haematopus]
MIIQSLLSMSTGHISSASHELVQCCPQGFSPKSALKGKTLKDRAPSKTKPVTARPVPRPIPSSEVREGRLRALTTFWPFQSLVQELLTKDTPGVTRSPKSLLPKWSSWDEANTYIGPDFFDTQNNDGHLSNWQAVLEWMKGNPHIPTNDSPLSHIQLSEILLVVGLTHRAAYICATAEEGSPLYIVAFEVSDLEKIEDTIKNMLVEAKSLRKFGVGANIHRGIENGWKKTCLEVGLAERDISAFGEEWKTFVEAYATIDAALVRSGKPPQLRAPEIFPEALDAWSHAPDVDGNVRMWDDDTNWEEEMEKVSREIITKVKTASGRENLDLILEEDWCRRGRGGIVCVVLGMKWWRISLLTSKDEQNKQSLKAWSALVVKLTTTFKLITEAKSIKRPESRRGGGVIA